MAWSDLHHFLRRVRSFGRLEGFGEGFGFGGSDRVSRGTDGAVKLGSTWLQTASLNGHAGTIASWGDSLSADRDILIYGCDRAASAEGEELVDSISALTGADVAASTDDTGSALLGGDWELELSVGSVETDVVFSPGLQDEWSGLLNTFTMTSLIDSGAGTLRQAILDANSLPGSDTTEFNFAGAATITNGANYVLTLSATAPSKRSLETRQRPRTDVVSDARFDAVAGQLKLKSGISLDLESEPAVNLTVTSSDLAGAMVNRAFVVTVNDLNDNAPVVDTGLTFGVSEAATNGTSLGVVTATDLDAGTTFSN